ncbi:MAG: hypothetical protein P8173_16035 [Gammaproteobacteria bacterium]
MLNSMKIYVSWLDGYLNALSALDGNIRDVFASAFLMEHGDKGAVDAVTHYFLPEADFQCAQSEVIVDWMRYMEEVLVNLILNNPFGGSVAESDLKERKRYVAFRIIEVIDFLVSDFPHTDLHDIQGKFEDSTDVCRFFVISLGEQYLVLQFVRPLR